MTFFTNLSAKMFICVMIAGTSGCATLPGENQDKIVLSETPKTDYPEVSSQNFDGIVQLSNGKSAEWFSCKVDKSKATAVLMHDESQAFSAINFCSSWQAQTFLSNGFDVVGLNRLGFGRSLGRSQGERGISDSETMAALEAAFAKALQSGVHKDAKAIWGYGAGATAAAYFSKTQPSIKVLFLGAGLYDLEEVLAKTSDKALKHQLGVLKKLEGEDALIESSLIYDPSDLARLIYLYHGREDRAVSPSQSQKFYDLLLSNRYDVSLELIAGMTHNIAWAHHRKILEVFLRASAPKLK